MSEYFNSVDFVLGMAVGILVGLLPFAISAARKPKRPKRVIVTNERDAAIARQAGYEPVYKFTREKQK